MPRGPARQHSVFVSAKAYTPQCHCRPGRTGCRLARAGSLRDRAGREHRAIEAVRARLTRFAVVTTTLARSSNGAMVRPCLAAYGASVAHLHRLQLSDSSALSRRLTWSAPPSPVRLYGTAQAGPCSPARSPPSVRPFCPSVSTSDDHRPSTYGADPRGVKPANRSSTSRRVYRQRHRPVGDR